LSLKWKKTKKYGYSFCLNENINVSLQIQKALKSHICYCQVLGYSPKKTLLKIEGFAKLLFILNICFVVVSISDYSHAES